SLGQRLPAPAHGGGPWSDELNSPPSPTCKPAPKLSCRRSRRLRAAVLVDDASALARARVPDLPNPPPNTAAAHFQGGVALGGGAPTHSPVTLSFGAVS